MKSILIVFMSLLPLASNAAKMDCIVKSSYKPKKSFTGIDSIWTGDKGGSLVGLRLRLNSDGRLEVTFSTDRFSHAEIHLEVGKTFVASVPGELQVYQISCVRTE